MDYQQQALDFLNATNTKLEISFKEFGSMPWDNDKQKRNIFSCTLSNEKHSYTFDFGASVVDSCGMESKLSQLIETDKIYVYAGVQSVNKQKLSAGIGFYLTKSQLLNTDSDLIEKYVGQLEKEYNLKSDAKNKKTYKLFEDGDISRKERDLKLLSKIPTGLAQQVIQKAIKAKIEELEKKQVYSKDLQGDINDKPTEYDILAAIVKDNPYTFEDFCSNYGYDEDSRQAERTYNSVVEEWENISLLFTESEIEQLQVIN